MSGREVKKRKEIKTYLKLRIQYIQNVLCTIHDYITYTAYLKKKYVARVAEKPP